jgi:hypothetical protein
MKITTTLILLLIFSVCSAQKNEKSTITIANAPGIVYEIGKGELFEGAIKIKFAKNSTEGIDAEKKYMENKYGVINVDFKPFGSEFYKVKGKNYNLIHIQLINKDDSNKDEFATIYFDVTDCFEK